jgi:hypothetical protein
VATCRDVVSIVRDQGSVRGIVFPSHANNASPSAANAELLGS